MFRSFILSAIAAFGFAATSQAETAQAYQCSVATSRASGGWVTSEYVFAPGQGGATVYDGLIKREFGKPVAAEVKEDTDKRMTLLWEMPLYNRAGQATIMRFRAVIFKQNNKVTVQARPAGYKNMFEGRGDCQMVAMKVGKP